MAIGTLTPRGRRITVDIPEELAALAEDRMKSTSSLVRKTTLSDVVREALAGLLLLGDGTNGSHMSTKNTAGSAEGGSL